MRIEAAPYLDQVAGWPQRGRHILAQYDDSSVVIYQAYPPSIGEFARSHGYFGGDFKLDRMSWIKPNFLWMMYRSGWGQKPGQTVVLAVRLRREAFDGLLAAAIHARFEPALYESRETWQQAVRRSDVRLQWDPDHDPAGNRTERRAIQLGLRGAALDRYAREWILEIEDVSVFVAEQHELAASGRWGDLRTPRERVYPVDDAGVARSLQLSGE